MVRTIDIIDTLNGSVNVVSNSIPETDIRNGDYFTSISGGYWDGKIISTRVIRVSLVTILILV